MSHGIAIGVTGGIASGKSAVSDAFAQLGVEIIDADVIARQVVEPQSYGLSQLLEYFGTGILNHDGSLNRSTLREIVFNNTEKRNRINAILHPLIHQEIKKRVSQVQGKYCIVVIPLLCESQEYHWLNRILVVDVHMKTQLKRLLKRDHITEELAEKMIKSQCSRAQRLSIADDVINNEQSLDELYSKIKVLDRMYKTL